MRKFMTMIEMIGVLLMAFWLPLNLFIDIPKELGYIPLLMLGVSCIYETITNRWYDEEL